MIIKKKLNKLLSIAISLALVISFAPNHSYATTEINEDQYEKLMDAQREACDAHEFLMSIIDPGGSCAFPDDYAGDYIDENILHVLITKKDSIGKYKDILKGFKSVKYDVVEYSYNELYYNAKQQYEFYENTYAIYAYSVDVMNNSSVIFAEEENEELSRVLKDQNVVLEVTGAFKEETTVTGGSPLNNSITLAGSGTYNGSTAFITCGHSLSGGSSVSYAGSTIGTVVVNVNSSGSSGDYSIISAASGYTPTSNVFSGGGNVVHYTGYVYHPSVGTNLYKYGSVSGSATCQVSHYSITVNGRTGLVGAKLTSGTTQSGDSGGPYRSGYSFCGIHMGSSTEPDGTVRVFFTPYQTVYNAGFTIKIN